MAKNDTLSTVLTLVGAVAGLFICGQIGMRVEGQIEPPTTGMSESQSENMENVASASLFGQFRSNMSDFLYLKVDKYLHSGVDLRAVTEAEQKGEVHAARATSAKGEGESGNRAHDGSETTEVPAKKDDWRGNLGDIERMTQPYMDMEAHTHRDPKEALPLFRLMTITNPHFVTGYVMGANMIARDETKLDDAISFLKEGEQNNPLNFPIKMEIGRMYTYKKKDYKTGFPYLEQAVTLANQRDQKTMTQDEVEAYEESYRWAVLNRRDAGDKKKAQLYATEGLKHFPDDVVCRKYLKENPL